MSEGASGETPTPETPHAAEGNAEPGSAEKDSGERAPTQEKEARIVPVIEHWQAPKPDKMKADSREIWEFESENIRPSGALWFNLAGIILALLLGLALIFYGVWWLASSIGNSGPEIP